ncbi:MAG TPA: hypothetical protein DDW61_03895 [Actinobacteria bacterium]|nr:hypothetical protein [Actinomycetota bacterium]
MAAGPRTRRSRRHRTRRSPRNRRDPHNPCTRRRPRPQRRFRRPARTPVRYLPRQGCPSRRPTCRSSRGRP